MARRSKRAPVGVALIVKDGQQTLPMCLKSLRPYVTQIVVCVDERTTDATAKVAARHGADVIAPVRVSDWHECPVHGRVLAQHFGRARNESFSHLDPALPWWMWIDADDWLSGGEHLIDVCASVPDGAVGAWAPYRYATVNNYAQTTTLFDRERLLRSSVGWRWDYRVHEVVVPACAHPKWAADQRVQVVHQEGIHKTEASTTRNQLLLEIDWEEAPDNQRTAFYLGNGYFASNQLERAVEWYERTVAIGTNPWEVWQSLCYLSISYRRLGLLTEATQAAFGAIDAIPAYKEGYFRLAEAYLLAGEHTKAIDWTKLGLTKEDPPRFVFVNPLDAAVNAHAILSDAYAGLGHVSEARRHLERAHAVAPSPDTTAGIARYARIEADAVTAQGFMDVAGGLVRDVQQTVDAMPGTRRRDELRRVRAIETTHRRIRSLYDALPPSVKAFGRTRDLAIPMVQTTRRVRDARSARPRIIFWCGKGVQEWAPPVLNTTGIGGSETAVVEIAARFARDGWRVDVYGSPGRYEGEYADVGYWEVQRLRSAERTDLLVSWRQPALRLEIDARGRILWLHDHNGGSDWAPALDRWDRVLGVSAYHRAFLAEAYGLPDDRIGYVPNGVDLERFDPTIPKVPFSAIYASSPDRGLLTLLDLWPRIAEHEPTAKLTVAYGFDTMQAWIDAGRHDLAEFKDRCLARMEQTPQVEYVGRLPQDELARRYAATVAWLYPSDFLETSCISAVEAMAGGCIPVCSSVGATKETVGDGGLVVWGPGRTRSNPYSPAWRDYFVRVAQGVLFERGTRLVLEAKARERAKALTWDASYRDHWLPIVNELLHGQTRTDEDRLGQTGEREMVAAG